MPKEAQKPVSLLTTALQQEQHLFSANAWTEWCTRLLQQGSATKQQCLEHLVSQMGYQDTMLLQQITYARLMSLRKQQNLVQLLPDEVLLAILKQCPVNVLEPASRVCKRWHRLFKDNQLWRHRVDQDVPVLSVHSLVSRQSSPEMYHLPMTPISPRPMFHRESPSSPVPLSLVCSEWKKIYKECLGTQRNWKKGQYALRTMETGMLCMSFDEHYVASVLLGNGKLWKISDGTPILQFSGHEGPITTVKFNEQVVLTAGRDGTLLVWDIVSGQCIRRLEGHDAEVSALEISKQHVISGDETGVVRVWRLNDGTNLFTLEAHDAAVTSVQSNEQQVVSSGMDNCIKIWNVNGDLLRRIPLGDTCTYTLQCDLDVVVSGDGNGTIKVFDIASGSLKQTLNAHDATVVCIQFDNDKIISGSADKTIKVWDRTTGFCMYTLRAHRDMVWSLKLTTNKLLSSSIDQTLAVWDFTHIEDDSE